MLTLTLMAEHHPRQCVGDRGHPTQLCARCMFCFVRACPSRIGDIVVRRAPLDEYPGDKKCGWCYEIVLFDDWT